MSFVIIMTLGLCLIYLFEKKKFFKLDALELAVISFGIGLSLLTIFGLLFQIVL